MTTRNTRRRRRSPASSTRRSRAPTSPHPTAQPVPYTGIQYVAIPEFQAIGTTVGQLMAGALTGQMSVDAALKQAQSQVSAAMQQAGYTQ